MKSYSESIANYMNRFNCDEEKTIEIEFSNVEPIKSKFEIGSKDGYDESSESFTGQLYGTMHAVADICISANDTAEIEFSDIEINLNDIFVNSLYVGKHTDSLDTAINRALSNGRYNFKSCVSIRDIKNGILSHSQNKLINIGNFYNDRLSVSTNDDKFLTNVFDYFADFKDSLATLIQQCKLDYLRYEEVFSDSVDNFSVNTDRNAVIITNDSTGKYAMIRLSHLGKLSVYELINSVNEEMFYNDTYLD